MEKYTKAQMDIIEFENEDVITSSTCTGMYSIDLCAPVEPGCTGIVF